MKTKINYWKTATIILFIAAVCLIVNYTTYVPYYNFDKLDFKIKQSDFKTVTNVLQPNQQIELCYSQTNKCVLVGRIR